MTPQEQFRAALKKIMPGYQWTVHKPVCPGTSHLVATGTQSSGFNRLSTVQVILREVDGGTKTYTAKSSGYGVKTPWKSESTGATLAQAFRRLQEHYEREAQVNNSLALALQGARKA